MLKANFGIKTLKPFKAMRDVAIIGPIIQAKGTLKQSAIIALGIEIKITDKNFFENISPRKSYFRNTCKIFMR